MESRESELRAQLDRLETMGMDWLKSLKRPDHSSKAVITINAGGIGIWIVSCFAAFMAGCTIFLAFVVVGQQQQIDRASDYISNVYQALPEIRQFIDHERKKSP